MIGDHIRALKGTRWTHAIDCGDETVILLSEDAGQPPRVRRSYRPEFVGGASAVEVVRHRERTFPAEEVVARAYSRLSEPGLAAMFRDSEAFADWCTTGRLPAGTPGVAPPAAPEAGSPRPAPARKRPAAKSTRAKGRKARKAPKAEAARKPPRKPRTKEAARGTAGKAAGGARRRPSRRATRTGRPRR